MKLNKPRVLFPFWGDTYGGSHIASLKLVEKLIENDQYEVIVGVHQKGVLTEVLNEKGISWMHLPKTFFPKSMIGRLLLMPFLSLLLTGFLKQKKINLVHTNDNKIHLLWGYACRYIGCHHLWHQRTKLSSRLSMMNINKSSKVVTISNFCKDSIVNKTLSASEDIELVYDPVIEECPKYHRQKKEKDLQHGIVKLLFVANLMPQKNFTAVIIALKDMREDYGIEASLTVAGEKREPYYSHCKDLAITLGVSDNIKYLGLVAEDDMNHLYQTHDLLIAPAIDEGLGMTLIEAAKNNCLVLASYSGGHKELIEDGVTGLFFEPSLKKDLSNKIYNIITSGMDFSKLPERAIEDYKNRFSIRAHTDKISGIYEKIIYKIG
ncbi:glycosyltransferase family 4 protein [Vibrio cincinnatiensis]|uniref:glycosyltransferase family 4 protein n=1 Tax=Vibrio cincinnatiensis TaxID=675 RepID=UPI001EDEA9DE|nr:glycosyltransferase family 4 protein [Vibrio cincinnatiensis]MCG3727434.1 glycosyltransferase [Vibrio cincinnatiensis]